MDKITEINQLILKTSSTSDAEIDCQTAKKLSLLLEQFFGDLDYTFIKSLQRGNCATKLVTSGIDLLACKEHLHIEHDQEEDFWRIPFNVLNDIAVSLFIHTYCKHCPYLPEFVSIRVSPTSTHILTKFIPLEFSDVFDRILPRQFLRQRIHELIIAMQMLHSHGFAHRDIKPENIRLKDNGSIVLIDFDTACRRESEKWKTKPVCSISTRPPELMTDVQSCYDARMCDVFSAGCTIVAMINDGKLPFGTEENRLKQIQSFQPIARLRHRIGKKGCQMIVKMLHMEPSMRPTSKELLADLFFKTAND